MACTIFFQSPMFKSPIPDFQILYIVILCIINGIIFTTLQIYARCEVPCQHICHGLGKSNIDLENIDNKWHREYNKYVILDDAYKIVELHFNCTLSKQCGPCFCQ